ncbi:MAG TPA: SLBB domain-containing protein [Methylomirabilota bacterium]|jgi:polysaccharide export outer membrane protein|nr:SLBB domain-containing protein [Methylomirabilota bacterium]
MTRRASRLGCIALVSLMLASCASSAPRPTTTATEVSREASGTGPTEAAPLPPPVLENESFVTVDGRAAYKIGPGDVLDILMTKEMAQDRLSAEVKPNGDVTVSFSEVKVAGLTSEQAAAEMRRALATTHRLVSVAVTVKDYRSKTVSVIGEVQNNSHLPLRGRTTLVDVLVAAGGPRAQANLQDVRLVRRDGRTYTIDVVALLADGDRLRDLVVDAGDLVFVPGKRTEDQKVFLLGEVNSPGAYPLGPKMRLSHALALAGGPKDTALLDSARVIRGDLRNPQVVAVDFERAMSGLDRSQDVALQANDVIVLPRTAIANWNAFLAKLKPTLEFAALPLTPFSQYLLLRELLR